MIQEEGLKRRETVGELVAAYRSACESVRLAFAKLEGAEKLLNDTLAGQHSHWLRIEPRHGHWCRWSEKDADEVIGNLRRGVWHTLVERLELKRFLSVGAWKELDRAIDAGEMPDITVESVHQVFESFSSQMPDLLRQAVVEVYDRLRPRNDRYKTNSQFRLGERVIIGYVVEPGYSSSPFRVRYHASQELTALENVFRAYDGQGQRTRGYLSDLEEAIKASPDGAGETTYFEFRACKNGNLHLKFRRKDLVFRLNQVAGGKSLPEQQAAAPGS